jgi:hypothetical protein
LDGFRSNIDVVHGMFELQSGEVHGIHGAGWILEDQPKVRERT